MEFQSQGSTCAFRVAHMSQTRHAPGMVSLDLIFHPAGDAKPIIKLGSHQSHGRFLQESESELQQSNRISMN